MIVIPLFKIRVSWCFHKDGFWFRFGGFGVSVLDRSKLKPLFSTRYGHQKEYKLGKWGIKFLNKADLKRSSHIM